MPFLPGQGGRPKGSKNFLNLRVEETVARLKIDPFEILCLFAKGDWKRLGYEKETRTAFTGAGIEFEEPIITPENRLSAAKEAAKYVYSQRRSIEVAPPDHLKDMTPEQKLEALRDAVKLLEEQVKK